MAIAQTPNGIKGISDKKALWLIYEYASQTGFTAEQTASVWFSLARLKEICKDYEDGHYDGIRLYLGRYPEGYPDVHPNVVIGSNTLVMIPTKTAGLRNIDFLPEARTTAILVEFAQGQFPDQKDLFPAENHGELCPPNKCDGTIIGGAIYNNIP